MPHALTTRTARCTVVACAVVSAAALAAPIAGAGRSHTLPIRSQGKATTTCSATFAPRGWIEVTDDLGIPWLTATGVQEQASVGCSAAAGQTGWVVVTDDQGVQWLVPSSLGR